MKAPVLPLLIACIFLFNPSFAQTNGKHLIKFYDHQYALAANKNGQLAITTMSGEVAFAGPGNENWRKTFVDQTVNGPSENVKIYNICYFNADTAFVSGVVYNGYRSEEIYHTVNGGKTWQRVKFGSEGPIDAAAFLDNGQAWLSVGCKDIAYTKDYGFTWTRLTVPYDSTDKGHRFSRIFFNKRAGIIGSRWNKLAYTNDNCKSWTIIPTPFNQGIHRAGDGGMPINKVAIFKDYLLVQQEDKVYYSDLHRIQWKPLPEYKDFYTDPENSVLYFMGNSGTLIKCDEELHPVLSIDNISEPFFITCKYGSLYALGRRKLWQINASNQLVETPLYTNVAEASDPVPFGDHFRYYSQQIGHIGNAIYTKRYQKWVYLFTLPFVPNGGTLSLMHDYAILFSRGDSVFRYTILNGNVSKANAANEIRDFSSTGIRKIIFTRSYGSCGGVGEEEVTYSLENNQFVLTERNIAGNRRDVFPKGCPDSIDTSKVSSFVQKLPAIHSKQVHIDELGLTQEDYDSCKRGILEIKSRFEAGQKAEYRWAWDTENQDFTKLITLVDSVKTISPESLNWYFLTQENFSTIHLRYKIKLVNNMGQELQIKNEEFYSNGFFCPWQIELNNLNAISTATEIRQFIKDVNPDFLRPERKEALIRGLVKLLYKQWQEAD
jgi:hypothetical protein